MDVVVDEDNLVIVIGCSGQNVWLVLELIGWIINLMIQDELVKCLEVEYVVMCVVFMDKLDIDEELVDLMIEEGFLMLEEVVYVLFVEMFEIDGLDEVIVNELCNCVCNVLLIEVIVVEEQFENVFEDLISFEGMSKELVVKLVVNGVKICDDFVELVVDEFMELIGIDDECVKEFILKVWVYWFE